MSESVNSDGSRPMIGSILRFVSDWVGNDARQPPPFRMRREEESPETVIEMQSLIERQDGDPNEDRQVQRALREWKQNTNVDAFLEQMYAYYRGNGFYGILLGRLCNLMILGFLVGFSLFLLFCVDWTFVSKPATAADHPTLATVTSLYGFLQMPLIVMLCTIAFYGILAWQALRVIREVPSLSRMWRFYHHLLKVPDEVLCTTEFSDVIDRIVELQRGCPISEDRLNAHEISNRILRRENYLIALFNRDLFKTELPFLESSFVLTKTLEWNLSFCILNYVFDENCSIRKGFLKDVKRDKLSQELQKRFLIMGIINLLLAPFIFVFLLAYFIFQYGEEVYRNPRSIIMRQYTTAARWKLREFNELPHYFDQRLANSHRKATKYMDQFQRSRFDSFARLISFIAGSLAVVLIGITIANEDLLMHFEITTGKSVIWYVGLLGVLLTLCRSMVPDASKAYDPSKLMGDIAEYTHYMPAGWKGKLHTDKVRREFGSMFSYKFTILLNELISVIVTPIILITSLPKCADDLVEFFREFTVHVDGVGYVCSFALFDFRRHGNRQYGGAALDNAQVTRDGKMEKSFLSFVSNNPNWIPNAEGCQFLGRMREFEASQDHHTGRVGGSTFLKPKASMLRRQTPELREEDELDELSPSSPGIMSILNKYYDTQNNP